MTRITGTLYEYVFVFMIPSR